MMHDAPDQAPSHYELNHEEAQIVKNQAFYYMKLLHGWCSEEKASFLIDLVLKYKPKTVVEIGVWGGKSLIPMACALKSNNQGKIYGIDPWSNQASLQGLINEDNKGFWSYVNHETVMQDLIDKTREFDLEEYIELIRSTSLEAAPIEGIDILHIDGNHSDETSYIDATKWVPLVKSGGLIIFDDITWTENGIDPSTSRAIGWINERCIKLAEFSDICVWGVWLKL